MPDAQGTLLSVVLFDAVIAGVVVGVFWLAVLLLRRLGKKIGYSLAPLGFSRPGEDSWRESAPGWPLASVPYS